jgi:hypothetical protein
MAKRMYREVVTVCLLVGGLLGGLRAQADYPSKLLIPYYEQGQWGYCDTLGTIRIAPQFVEADFFREERRDGRRFYWAQVETPHGTNYLSGAGVLYFPPEANVISPVELSPAIGQGYLVERGGQLGIFTLDGGWLSPPTYDTLSWLAHEHQLLLLKRDSSVTFDRIDRYSGEATPTDIVALQPYEQRGSPRLLAQHLDGRYSEVMDGMLFARSPEQLADYQPSERLTRKPTETFEVFYNSYRKWQGPLPKLAQLGVDSILDSRDFSTLAVSARYGFQQLIIGTRDGQQGVVNEAGKIILPFSYDSIDFVHNGSQARLRQADRYGYKLFLCPYPTIEPTYDHISLARMLYVRGSWSFAVLAIELAGERAYLGENGLAYYKFN